MELLEYKVAEYRAKRTVRGGMASLWDLVALLSRDQDRLDVAARRRFTELTNALSQLAEKPTEAGVPSLNTLVLEDETVVELASEAPPPPAMKVAGTPLEREEHAILQRLARRVWWDDLEEFVQRIAATWRAEQGRGTARLVFAAPSGRT